MLPVTKGEYRQCYPLLEHSTEQSSYSNSAQEFFPKLKRRSVNLFQSEVR